MALVVFLRGVNVGGHKAFQPTVLARALAALDVKSIGAAGTFVVRGKGGGAGGPRGVREAPAVRSAAHDLPSR